MMKAVSFDPGITTGFSLGILDESCFFVAYEEERLSHRDLWNILQEIQPDHVVCESFEYRNNQHRDNLELYSLELIGVVKLYGHEAMQNAAKGKGFYKDEKLKKMGLYRPGVGHGRDAVRHLLHWFTFGPGFKYNAKGTRIMLAQFQTLLEKGDNNGT